MTIEVLYFASLREAVGQPRETIDSDAATVAALIEDLVGRGEPYVTAFADRAALRCAVDQRFGDGDTPLAGAREVAFFPR